MSTPPPPHAILPSCIQRKPIAGKQRNSLKSSWTLDQPRADVHDFLAASIGIRDTNQDRQKVVVTIAGRPGGLVVALECY